MKALVPLLICLLLCGCGGGEDPAPAVTPTPTPVPTPVVLSVCVDTEGSTIDPTYLSEPVPSELQSHLFEGLMRYAPEEGGGVVTDSVLCLGLAESVERSQDGLTYRFLIREDACWSDGVPVRSGDFVYAWRRLLSPPADAEMAHAAGAAQLYGIVKHAKEVAEGKVPGESLGVWTEGDRVLVVALEKPCAWFPKLCAMACMVPLRQDVIEAYGGDWTDESHIVVSGAYTIEEWVHDDYMRLRPNPHYYEAERLGPDEIVWYFGQGREADFVSDVSDSAADGSVAVAGTYYLYLNANAIRDWRIRAAMLLSLDREALADTVGSGARPALSLVPEGIALTDGTVYAPSVSPMYAWAGLSYPQYDLTNLSGRRALAMALADGARGSGSLYNGYTLYYRFNESEMNRAVAMQCKADWEQVLGLRVELVPMGLEDYEKRLGTNTFDVAYLSWLPDHDDPLSFLQIMKRGGANNHSGWGDVRYNEQLALAEGSLDASARDLYLRRAEEMLYEAERFAVCPLFWFGQTYAVKDGVGGIGHNAVNGYCFLYTTKE